MTCRGLLATLLGSGLVLLACQGAFAAAPPAFKVGVVDVQQVLNQSQRGQAVKGKLDQERAGRQKELDARQQELAKAQAEFEKQAPVLSEQAKRERAEGMQKKIRDVRRLAEDANRELEKRVREAEMDVTREIFAVIQEYGKDQGFSLVLERSSIIFSAPTVDVTSEIIKRFDGKGK